MISGKRRWLFVVSLLLTAARIAAQDTIPAQVSQCAHEGAEAAAQGNWALAEQKYRSALHLAPDSAEAMSNLGVACYFQRKYNEAEAEFRAARRTRPDLFVPDFFLGRQYVEQGRYSQAVFFLKDGGRLQPQNLDIHRLLAKAFVGQENYLGAIQEFQRTVQQDPRDVDAFYGMGKIYMQLAQSAAIKVNAQPALGKLYHNLIMAYRFQGENNWETARSYYLRVLQANHELPGISISVELGNIALATQDWKAAIQEFRQGLALDPKSYLSHFGWAQADLNLGDLESSLHHLQEAIRIRPEFFRPPPSITVSMKPDQIRALMAQLHSPNLPENAGWNLELAVLANALGDAHAIQAAMSSFEIQREASEKALLPFQIPGSMEALKKAAAMGLNDKRYEAAAAGYSRLIRLSPRDVAFHRGLVQSLFEAQEYDRTAAALRELLQLVPQDAHSQFLLHRCYDQLAFQNLKEIVRLNPNSYRLHELSAELLLDKDRAGQAIEEYKQALAAKPDDGTLHFSLGVAYAKAMKLQPAIDEFQAAARVDPFNAETFQNMGRCYIALHQPDEAIRSLREAIRLKPNTLAAHGLLGRALAIQGKPADAVREMEIGAPSDKDGSLHYQLFLAYRKLGDSSKAESALHASEELHKQDKAAYQEEVRGVMESLSSDREGAQR